MIFKNLLLLIVFFNFVSCARLEIVLRKNDKDNFSKMSETQKSKWVKVEYKTERTFYLWGLVPENEQIDVINDMLGHGVKNLTSIKVTEESTPWNILLSVLSFGLYIPKTYAIFAIGEKQ